MKYARACLFIGMAVLAGCNTAPKEFAVYGAPVYIADDVDRTFPGEGPVVMKFYDNGRSFTVGRIENGTLTFTLPAGSDIDMFETSKLFYSITPGLRLISVSSEPTLFLHDKTTQQSYYFVYANKKGSATLDGKKHTFYKGWNLLNYYIENAVQPTIIPNNPNFRWVCDTNISIQYYLDEGKKLSEQDYPIPIPPQEKPWWED
jgi:hypothetical protein